MMTTGRHGSPVQSGISGWISIHINCEQSAIEPTPAKIGMESKESPGALRAYGGAEDEIVPMPERFTRFAFAAVALALLLSSLTAGLDFLRGAGN